MPVHHFVPEGFIVDKGLSNYWGYSTLGFFAPHGDYAAAGDGGPGPRVVVLRVSDRLGNVATGRVDVP